MARCFLWTAAVVVVALLAVAATAEEAPLTVTLHRALSFDRLARGTKTVVNLEAGSSRKVPVKGPVALNALPSGKSVGHKVLVTDLSGSTGSNDVSFNAHSFLSFSTLAHIVILPPHTEGNTKPLPRGTIAFLEDLQNVLSTEKVGQSVMFAYSSDQGVATLLDKLNNVAAFDDYAVTFEPSTDLTVESLNDGETIGEVVTLYGGRPATAAASVTTAAALKDLRKLSKGLPTVVITASVDTMSVAPSLVAGSGSGSGLAVFMELARIFGKAYKATPGLKKNLVFVADQNSRLNYAGTTAWIEQVDSSSLDDIVAVVCLDDLLKQLTSAPSASDDSATTDEAQESASAKKGSNADLYFHVSRSPKKDASVKEIYDALSKVAQENGLNLELNVKKINVSHHEIQWSHQAFSFRSVFAGTLSSAPTPRPQLSRSSLISSSSVASSADNEKRLLAVTKFLAQWLSQVLELPESAAKGVSATHLAAWNDAGARIPRPASSTSFKTASELFVGSLNDELARAVEAEGAAVFGAHTKLRAGTHKKSSSAGNAASTATGSRGDLPFVLYGPSTTTMSLLPSKATSFEIIVFSSVLGYLFLAANVLYGPTGALKALGLKR